MKKIFISLFVLIIFGLFFTNTVFAQTNNFGSLSGGVVVATVSINNAKIVSQNDRDFVISFDISNKIGSQSKVKYSIQLVKISSLAQTIFDEKFYDEALFLSENMTIHKTVNYIVPSSVSAGTYTLYIRSQNASGLPLSIIGLGDIKISANILGSIEIIPNTCTFSYSQNKYFEASTNNNISTGYINAKCKVKNTFLKDTPMVLDFVTRSPSVFGNIIPIFGSSTRNILIKKGTNDVTIMMPKAKKPQYYNLSFHLTSTDTKILSNTISYDYFIAGEQGIIKNVVFDKTYYKSGDTANVQIYSSQSSTSTISAIIRGSSGEYCSATSSKVVSSVSITNLLIPIEKNCLNPKAGVILSAMNGKILDSNNLQIITTTGVTSKRAPALPITIVILILIIFLLLIIGILIYKNKSRGLKVIILILFCFSAFSLKDKITFAEGIAFFPEINIQGPGSVGFAYSTDLKPYVSFYCDIYKNGALWVANANGWHPGNWATPSGKVIQLGAWDMVTSNTNYLMACRNAHTGASISTEPSGGYDIPPGNQSVPQPVYPPIDPTTQGYLPYDGPDTGGQTGPAISDLTASMNPVEYNGSTQVSANVSNSSFCVIDGPDGSWVYSDVANPIKIVLYQNNLSFNATFNAYCVGLNNNAVANSPALYVSVEPYIPPAQTGTIGLSAIPTTVSYGGDTIVTTDISSLNNISSCAMTSSQGGTIVYDFSHFFSVPKSISVYSNNMTLDTTFQTECYDSDGFHSYFSVPLTVNVLPESFNVTLSPASSTVNKGDSVKVNWNANESGSICQITTDDTNIQSYSNLSASDMSAGVRVGPITSTTTVSIECQNKTTSASAAGAIQGIDPILAPFLSLYIIPQGDSFGSAGFYTNFDSRSIPYDNLVSGYQQGQQVTILNPILPNTPFPNQIDDISVLYNQNQVGCLGDYCASINIDSVDHPYGGIISLHLNDGGEGYSVGDQPLIMSMTAGQGGGNVKVSETDGVAGAIKNISVLYGGSGYKIGDKLIVQAGNGDAIINVDSIDENGSVTGVSLIENGSGYISSHMIGGEYPSDVSGGNGNGLQVGVDDVYGKILSLSYDPSNASNFSSDYSVGDTAQLIGGIQGMGGATIQIDQVGQGTPTKISLSQVGSGYQTGWSYPIDGPGYPLVTIAKAQPMMNFFTSDIPMRVATSSVIIKPISSNPPSSRPIIHRKNINTIEWEADGAKSCSLTMNGLIISNATSGVYQVLGGIKDTDIFTISCDPTGSATISGKTVNLSAACVPSQSDNNLYVNKNTTWTIIPFDKTKTLRVITNTAEWRGDEISGVNSSYYPLNIIYRTVGEKFLHGTISVLDPSDTRLDLECETTTTVKLDKGTINEI